MQDPGVLWHQRPEALVPKMALLSSSTGLTYPEVATLVNNKPGLLAMGEDELRDTVREVEGFGFSKSGLVAVLGLQYMRAPIIVSILRDKLQTLALALGMELEDMTAMVVKEPVILKANPSGGWQKWQQVHWQGETLLITLSRGASPVRS